MACRTLQKHQGTKRSVVPADSSVQFKALAGIVNFWVSGGSIFSWYDYAPKLLKERGDIVWIYGEAPGVTRSSTAITQNLLRTWLYGIDGWVHWLTVSPGNDPWFHFGGGSTALAYPGERFGLNGPIPSLRLKIQRNCVQDITLLDSFKARYSADYLKTEAARRFNGTSPKDWWTPRPTRANLPPYLWTNSSIDHAMEAAQLRSSKLDSASWENVRRFVMEMASEAK